MLAEFVLSGIVGDRWLVNVEEVMLEDSYTVNMFGFWILVLVLVLVAVVLGGGYWYWRASRRIGMRRPGVHKTRRQWRYEAFLEARIDLQADTIEELTEEKRKLQEDIDQLHAERARTTPSEWCPGPIRVCHHRETAQNSTE